MTANKCKYQRCLGVMSAPGPENPASGDQAGDRPSQTPEPAHETKGLHLYNVLGVDKKATDDDIKRAYRKLALRYHPDKNLDGDPEKTEKFKEINYANGILSNPKKRQVYDEMGETGLKLMEQFGEDNEFIFKWMLKPWFKRVFFGLGILTCGFFCCCCGCMCCCQCCCNFCCGKYTPASTDEYQPSDAEDLEGGEGAGPGPSVIVMQPAPTDSSPDYLQIDVKEEQDQSHDHGQQHDQIRGPNGEEPVRPAVIVLGPPPSSQYGSVETSN